MIDREEKLIEAEEAAEREQDMTEKERCKAEENGILDKVQALESALLQIKGVNLVEFDLDAYEDCHQVILLPHYDAGPLDGGYYGRRNWQLLNILITCSWHDLHRSGDHIEDYQSCWYIVRDCGVTWPHKQ